MCVFFRCILKEKKRVIEYVEALAYLISKVLASDSISLVGKVSLSSVVAASNFAIFICFCVHTNEVLSEGKQCPASADER